MRTWTAMLVLVSAVLVSGFAHAARFEQGLQELASDDYAKVASGIASLAASGNARAIAVLEALEAGRLRYDDAADLYIDRENGLVLARTEQRPARVGTTKVVPTNNRVRRALGPALSRLRLLSPDVDTRRAAALDLAKHPDPDTRDVMGQALSQETDAEIQDFLSLALARLDLSSEDTSTRLEAVKTMRRIADVGSKAELESLLAPPPAGETEAAIRLEAQAALRAINVKTTLVSLVANTFYGLSLGSILMLAALGLGITFGLMRVINMAHGEMLMLGAYTTFVVQNLFSSFLPQATDFYLVMAFPAAFLVCGVVGILLERIVLRHLYGRPLETLLATWGISLMLIQTVRLIFGAQNVTVANPSWLSGGFELMPNLVMPYSRLFIVAFTLVVVLLLGAALYRTNFGLRVRAVTQNRAMASSMGISARRVDAFTFGLGSGVAGLGGVALSQIGNVGPELGQAYIVDSFMVVVLGGVGKLLGAVVGAFGVGLLNKYVEPMAGAVLGKIVILGLIVLFIQKRPQGMFALKGRAAELS